MKAVIPAAGLGIRFLPLTKAQPKEMLPIVDKPCIQYVVEEAVKSGITDIVIITGRGKRAIENHFDRSIELEHRLKSDNKLNELNLLQEIDELADIFYIRQKEPLGLGHAVLCAKKHVGNEPFAVLLGDDIIINRTPVISQLIEIFEERNDGSIVGVERLPREILNRYGVISGREIRDGLYIVENIVEKPLPGSEPSDLAVIGRYVFTPEIFDLLERTTKGVGGEIQLTDAMHSLVKQSKLYGSIVSGRRYDIGSRFAWLRANIELSLESPEMGEQMRDLLAETKIGRAHV